MGILPAKENTSKPVRMPFTNTEEAALRTGVELHGTGAWAVILGSGRFAPTRTNVDLKDKWRNMATGIQKGAAEDKRLGRLDRKRPASALPPAADIRVAKAKRLPVDELVGLRPYLSDIHRLYQETEGLKHASSSYMNKQPDINAKMRAILIDWLVEVHLKFKLVPETLYLTVSLIDRFLERKVIPRNKLQLVGVTAMFVACKYEEVFPPACSDLISVSDKLYSRDEILRTEGQILSQLSFELTSPSALVFLRRFAKVAGIAAGVMPSTVRTGKLGHGVHLHIGESTMKTEMLANYLVELTLQEDAMRQYLPSTLCAAAICLALKTRGEPAWSSSLEQHSTYTEADLQPCVRDLHALHVQAAANGLQAVRKKYAQDACYNVSGIAPASPTQLGLAAPRAEPPAALRESPVQNRVLCMTRYGPKSAARWWVASANVIVVD